MEIKDPSPNLAVMGRDGSGSSENRLWDFQFRDFSQGWKCTSDECQLKAFGACTEKYHEPVPAHLWNTARDKEGRVDEKAEEARARELIARLPTTVVGEGRLERVIDHRFSWEACTGGSANVKTALGQTGMVHDAFERRLAEHPDRLKVALLLDTIRNGANVTYDGPREATERMPNHTTDPTHLEFLKKETEDDIAKARTKGWYEGKLPIANAMFSPLHVVPKMRAGEEVGLRKIMDASAPKGHSVNDGMRKILTRCQTWPHVLEALRRCGPRAWLTKRDIKGAFRHVKIREADHHLHGIEVDGKLAYEITLAFGVRTSPPIWDRVASALTWILKREKGVRWEVVYYVDDFLLIVPHGEDPVKAAALFDAVCAELGLVVAKDKNEGPTTRLVFTGTGIDTESMTIYVPEDRKKELMSLVGDAVEHGAAKGWVSYKKAASLVGKIMFACRAMPAAKPFGWHLMQALGTGKKRVKIGDAAMRDLLWWQAHLPKWSGCSLLNLSEWIAGKSIELETDASKYGWGIVWGNRWACGRWTREERENAMREKRESMPWFELYAIVRAAKEWGHMWKGKRITFTGDCRGITQALNKNYMRKPAMAALLRVLSNCAVKHEFEWRCRWIEGETNVRADPISRGRVQEFLKAFPSMKREPEALDWRMTPIRDTNY